LKHKNNDPICVTVISADAVKINVATNVLADNDPVTVTLELANATTNPVNANVATNKLANNDPVNQTGTLKKA
jgi:hypothetical protein